jgi:two-component system chemotaxis sensor kinase CheA
VLEIARVKEQEIHQVDNYEILQLRESVLTIVRLGQHHNSENSGDAKVFVVVIQLGDRKYGLIVDELTGEEELVIKPLNDRLVATDLVSGASILGDGTVVLILNLASLVQRHAKISRVRAGQMVSNLLGRGTEVASGNSGFTGGAA